MLEWTVIGLMGALALVVVAGVVFRKVGAALVWYDEGASVLLAWLTYFGAALAASKQAHIGFPGLVAKLSLKWRLAVVVCREILVLAFLGVVAWSGWRVLSALEGETLVSLPWMPASVAHSVIPIGAILFILAQLLAFPGRVRRELETGEGWN
ncbi:MAG: TRAP transporter small permease [Acidobacteriota bacterium]